MRICTCCGDAHEASVDCQGAPIDWDARRADALEYMDAWRLERDEALAKRRPMKWLAYQHEEHAQ